MTTEPLPGYAAALLEAARLTAPDLELERLPGDQLPQPQRDLLVHDRDMTPTLERHHDGTIYLRVLRSEEIGHWYHRHSVLLLHGSRKPVECGLIRINLQVLPSQVAELVRLNVMPLGTLLHHWRIPHACRPGGFFRITHLGGFAPALHETDDAVTYGRANVITAGTENLAEILEILPSHS